MGFVSYVYLLRHEACPHEGYIGKANDPEDRYKEHKKAADSGEQQNNVYVWWRRLLAETGVEPTWHIIDTLEAPTEFLANAAALARESERIAWARAQPDSYVLHNMNDGGHGGRNPLPETRAKMRVARLGVVVSVETRQKLAASNLGRRASAETRIKMSAAKAGRALPEQTRERMAAAQQRPERRATQAAAVRRRGAGVRFDRTAWEAIIHYHSRKIHVGRFATEAEARAARAAAELKYWGPPEDESED